MTSTIEWDEDWFSLEEKKKADDTVKVVEEADLAESVESIKEWIEKDIRIQEKEREKSVNEEKRMDWLEMLVHQQAEMIRVLKEEVRVLKKRSSP